MIAVIGATGNVGGELVRVLAAGGERVTAGARTISADDVPAGVRVVRVDLCEPETLRPLLAGAEALFLQSGGASALQLDPNEVVRTAKSEHVRRIVLLSSQGVATRPDSASHGAIAHRIEESVRNSGLEWTILRPGGFDSNAYAWAESIRSTRRVAAPFGDVGLPTIDPADIAEVAAVALREDGHAERIHELTGPALVTPRQRTQAIAEALGEPIEFVEQSRAEAREQMLGFMPEPVVETTLDILGRPTAAEQRISPDVEKVLGRSPRTFADWAIRNLAAFE